MKPKEIDNPTDSFYREIREALDRYDGFKVMPAQAQAKPPQLDHLEHEIIRLNEEIKAIHGDLDAARIAIANLRKSHELLNDALTNHVSNYVHTERYIPILLRPTKQST